MGDHASAAAVHAEHYNQIKLTRAIFFHLKIE
jgi:hypothetical protein